MYFTKHLYTVYCDSAFSCYLCLRLIIVNTSELIMGQHNAIKLFEEKKVRTLWDDKEEKWYFSIVDVVGVLTDSPIPRKYWSVLKTRLKKEGSELTTNCSQLKMKSADGKMYLTDVADVQQLLRLIQSIPSPKAEPFKQWMAQVAAERLDQIQDPELSIRQGCCQSAECQDGHRSVSAV